MEVSGDPDRPNGAADRPLLRPLHRPRIMNVGVALLVVGVVPWLLIYLGNVVTGDVGRDTSGGLLLLGLGYVGGAIAVWNGGARARIAVTVATILFYTLTLILALDLAGDPGELSAVFGFLVIVLLTGAISTVGLVLIWRSASSLFIAEAIVARRIAIAQRRRRRST